MTKLKVLVGFAQVLCGFKDAFRLDNPPEFDEFVENVRVLALDFLTVVRPGCLWTPDFLVKLQFVSIAPLLAARCTAPCTSADWPIPS